MSDKGATREANTRAIAAFDDIVLAIFVCMQSAVWLWFFFVVRRID